MQCNGWPSNKRGIDIETFRAQKHSRNKQKKRNPGNKEKRKENYLAGFPPGTIVKGTGISSVVES
jgi:hypothetical protein